MKVSSRDILDILRRFELAGETNVPRNIDAIKVSHPHPANTLATFRFNKSKFYVLFDDLAGDDENIVIKQIKTDDAQVTGDLLKNPAETSGTFAMPFKGKDCYLFEVVSTKKRLDSELATRYPNYSRNTWQKYIKSGFVSVNNKIIESPKHDITDVDTIQVNLPAEADYEASEFPIIYIDDNVIVINKPIGILTHSKGEINEEFTVADFFKRYTTYNLETNRPGIIHRLDRDTSGVLVGARNIETALYLQKQFSDRKVKKSYIAILNGIPKHDQANIDLPIGRNPSQPSTFRVDGNGKSAQTYYEILARNDTYSLVRLQPMTGRTHQLRVHMKYMNTPILGDRVYGTSADRMYLHAYTLELTIPTSKRITFTAPLPDDFKNLFPGVKL